MSGPPAPPAATPGQATMRASVSDRTTHGDDIDLITRLRASASDWAVKCATACNERDEAQDERDAARADLARARKALEALDRIVISHARSMYAAHIDTVHGDPNDASAILLEALDGWDGPQWNGTETGVEWLERTYGEGGDHA